MRDKNLFLPKILKPSVLNNQTMCPFTWVSGGSIVNLFSLCILDSLNNVSKRGVALHLTFRHNNLSSILQFV